jgi:hypothetical protein
MNIISSIIGISIIFSCFLSLFIAIRRNSSDVFGDFLAYFVISMALIILIFCVVMMIVVMMIVVMASSAGGVI